MMPLDATRITSIENLGVVGGWMLAPKDEARRKRYIGHFEVLEGIERLAAVPPNRAYYEALVLLALDAASAEEVSQLRNENAGRACGAGMVLYNACLRIPRGESKPVQTALQQVAGVLGSKKHSASSHPNEAIWKAFRAVAHLWAAFIHLDDGTDGLVQFPCEPNRLPEFLSLAEEFRKLGESMRPPKRADPLLNPGETVKLPDAVTAMLPGGMRAISKS